MSRIAHHLRSITFIHQLYVTMAVAILTLAVISSLALSWQSSHQTSAYLIDQGLQVAENLARQSQLALVYGSPENAAEAINTTLAFPDVSAVEIRWTDGRLMFHKSRDNQASESPKTEAPPGSFNGQMGRLESDTEEDWKFVAPVISGKSNDSQSNMEQPPRELLGYVRIVKTKRALIRMRNDLLMVNVTVSLLVAIVLLIIVRLLTKQMTQPLTKLFTAMADAKKGKGGSRAVPTGPKDIQEMALMFNEMMDALEGRNNELRIANDNALQAAKERIEAAQQERERLESTVAERTKSLNELLETRAMIVSNASHELRTPVNAMRLLLDATTLGNHERRGIMVKLNALIRHMYQLVENLLLLNPSQMKTTQGGIVQEFDLNEEIRATVSMLESQRQQTSAKLILDIEPCQGIMVRGDLTSLRRIIINMLSNAFKFTTSGSVTVRAAINLDDVDRKTTCTMMFKDTGCGIPSDMQSRIFEPFVTTGTKSGHTGTGLGLSISRKLAEDLHGYLRLNHSVEGEGSEFECQVSFEWGTHEGIGQQADIVSVPNREKRFRILVAEDDQITSDAMGIIIRHLNHDVDCVSTYQELKDRLFQSEVTYDYALIDNRMPGGYGIDLIKLVRQENLVPNTCIVLLSADTGQQLLEEAATYCDHVLTKPTSARSIQQLLGKGIPAEESVNKNPILDTDSLNMLINSGATKEQIKEMCDLLLVTVRKELMGLRELPFTDDGHSKKVITDVVHRMRSSCATVGAIALGIAFKELTACPNRESFKDQLVRIETALELTMTSLKQLQEQNSE